LLFSAERLASAAGGKIPMRWMLLGSICLLGCDASQPAAGPASAAPVVTPASPEEEIEVRKFAAQTLADHGITSFSALAAASDGVRMADGTWIFEGRVKTDQGNRVDYSAAFAKERGKWKTMLLALGDGVVEGDMHLANRQLERARRMRTRAVAQAPDAQPVELRTWKSATGEFTTEAAFVSRTADQVKLRRADGNEINVPLDRLSDEDRQWLRDYEKGR
jgi:hypothetical protein